MSAVEEDLRRKIKKLEAEMKHLRENELPHLDKRISELENLIKSSFSPPYLDKKISELESLIKGKRFTSPSTKHLYDGLIGVLSLLSFVSIFSTVTGFFSLTLGVFLSAACLIALLLFVVAR